MLTFTNVQSIMYLSLSCYISSVNLATNNKIKDKNPKKKHTKLMIGLIITAVVVILLLYLYETYGSLPSGLATAVLSGKPLTASEMQTLLLHKMSSYAYFKANYTGNMTINTDPPIFVSLFKVGSNYFYYLTLYNMSTIGNLDIGYTYPVNGSLRGENLCVSSNSTSIVTKLNTELNAVICKNPSNHTTFSGKVANLLVNASSLENINITNYGLSEYAGQPCYLVSGSGTIEINSSIMGSTSGPTIPAKINFNTCLSAQYNLPLYLILNTIASNGGTMEMYLYNTEIGPSAPFTMGGNG